ncbi:hypothetical protein ACQ5SK_13755 [Bradyrhizobium japonicum]
MLFSISELFRHYDEFDPLDLLIVHAILNANVINVMNDPSLDEILQHSRGRAGCDQARGVPRGALSLPQPAARDGSPSRDGT